MGKLIGVAAAAATFALLTTAASAAPPANVRLSNDFSGGGYVSAYTLATGKAYTDGVLQECSVARGRQNEPAVAVDPRNASVILGSSNDYCGVYGPPGDPATGNPAGPIWLGYYRSQNGGQSFQSSLVPGYPGDTSPYAALAQVRTASAGDPVVAWDSHGRAFFGAESSGDPSGTLKGFYDEWVATYDNSGGGTVNDGKRFVGSVTVAKGSSAPVTGKFNDKTDIQVDRTGGQYDGNVYFAWSRFTGNSAPSNIYFVRSTDHGRTFSNPVLLTSNSGNAQDPRIDVTGNGDVYVTFDVGALKNGQPDGIQVVKSTDGGATFGKPVQILTYTPWNESDVSVLGGANRDCGDDFDACVSGYTFFRNGSATESSSDQSDKAHQYIYMVFNASKPGTEVQTGNTYGTEGPGVGSQSGAYYVRYDGATGTITTPKLLAPATAGHQTLPDITADGGVLHTEWWDSRNDPCYSPARPIGNCANLSTVPSLDVYASTSTNGGSTWSTPVKLTSVRSNGNWEQFDNRRVPFGGDYLSISSRGSFAFSTWTDWRNTVAGTDPRFPADGDGADVKQCRVQDSTGAWGNDTCPHAGGLDQDIYGAVSP